MNLHTMTLTDKGTLHVNPGETHVIEIQPLFAIIKIISGKLKVSHITRARYTALHVLHKMAYHSTEDGDNDGHVDIDGFQAGCEGAGDQLPCIKYHAMVLQLELLLMNYVRVFALRTMYDTNYVCVFTLETLAYMCKLWLAVSIHGAHIGDQIPLNL